MDPVEQHLKIAIYRWVGLKPPAYGPSSSLSDMWARVYSAPYIWDGVRTLGKTLYADPFFQGCPAAQQLTPPMFGPGGPIQTVAQLYNALYSCGQTEEALDEKEISEKILFADSADVSRRKRRGGTKRKAGRSRTSRRPK